jgi:uncharacterized protein YodC (DUF2158 family)
MTTKHDCKFKPGDIVQFSIGGPKMVVVVAEPLWHDEKLFSSWGFWHIDCRWWKEPELLRGGEFVRNTFKEIELKKVK